MKSKFKDIGSREGEETPNDRKLSDRRARRGGSAGDRRRGAGWAKVAGWLVAAAVTCAPVRCSAWLGPVRGGNPAVIELSFICGNLLDDAGNLNLGSFGRELESHAVLGARIAEYKGIVIGELDGDRKRIAADAINAAEACPPSDPRANETLMNAIALKGRNTIYGS